MEFGGTEWRRQGEGSASTSTKRTRSRAAEVHNQSERRRRDRINEKMKTLRELIPRCRQTDKASMLDEVVEYTKLMQRLVQIMMSIRCGMVPVMYPGMQQYMVGMGMGMGAGMTSRPMVPYPAMLPVPGSAMPNTATASNMGPRFPTPVFANRPSVQNFVHPYQQVFGLLQTQLALPQNQATVRHNAEASTSREASKKSLS